MYLISGITGHTGSAVAATLLAANKKLRAFVRDPAKAAPWAARGVEIVTGDVADAAALAKAMTGALGAYVLVPPGPDSADPVGSYLAAATATRAAARAAKLPRLVHLSSVGAQHAKGNGPIRGSHLAEAVLADAAPEVTFVRAAGFQENGVHVWPLAAAQGIMPTFLKDLDAKTEQVAAAEIGRVAAEMLMADKPARLVELGGPAPASVRDAAAAMSSVLGKPVQPVQPVQPPRDKWLGIFCRQRHEPALRRTDGRDVRGLEFGARRVLGHGAADARAGDAGADVQVVEDIKCMQIVLEGPGLAIESPASPATRAPPQPR